MYSTDNVWDFSCLSDTHDTASLKATNLIMICANTIIKMFTVIIMN